MDMEIMSLPVAFFAPQTIYVRRGLGKECMASFLRLQIQQWPDA